MRFAQVFYTDLVIQFFPTRQIAINVGPLAVHWYGIMYAVAFLVGIALLPRLSRISRLQLTSVMRDNLVLFMFLGVLLGGRLGFVLFYGGGYYFAHPLEMLAVWQGGMSSHGGFIGVALALFYFAWKYKVDLFRITDTIVVPVALGLMLGRLGNFINGELYGTVTSLSWGMHFEGAEGLRHPTQLYAMVKDLLLATVCYFSLLSSYKHEPAPTGTTTSLFLCTYAVLRFLVEIFRDQPYGYTQVLGFSLSRGQILTIPLFLLGLVLFFMRRRAKAT